MNSFYSSTLSSCNYWICLLRWTFVVCNEPAMFQTVQQMYETKVKLCGKNIWKGQMWGLTFPHLSACSLIKKSKRVKKERVKRDLLKRHRIYSKNKVIPYCSRTKTLMQCEVFTLNIGSFYSWNKSTSLSFPQRTRGKGTHTLHELFEIPISNKISFQNCLKSFEYLFNINTSHCIMVLVSFVFLIENNK